jgi:hypothetical protein
VNAFFFLQGMDDAKQVIGRGVSTWTEHAHQTFRGFVDHCAQFFKPNFTLLVFLPKLFCSIDIVLLAFLRAAT